MKPSSDQHNAFLAGAVLPGVTFVHNQYVEVVSGQYCGSRGSILSVEELGSDPLLLVELDPGGDVELRQSCIRLLK
jgi:hypothetical protein